MVHVGMVDDVGLFGVDLNRYCIRAQDLVFSSLELSPSHWPVVVAVVPEVDAGAINRVLKSRHLNRCGFAAKTLDDGFDFMVHECVTAVFPFRGIGLDRVRHGQDFAGSSVIASQSSISSQAP